MKKLFLFWIALLIYGGSFGQSTANYVFSYSFTGSLQDISTGATTLLTGNNDDNPSTVNNIGFTFYFMGTPYTQFSINSNGQMRLGSTVIGGSAISSYSASVPILAPMAGDNEVNNGASFKVIGTAPNRILVVEWNQFYAYYTNIAGSGNMQVLLYEGTGKIDFIYGDIYNSSSSSVNRSIFISSSNTATTGAHVTVGATPTYTPAAAPVTNAFAASVLIANLGSTAQGSRTVYTFTPPAAPTAASNLTFSTLGTTKMTINWTDSPNEAGYAILRSTDGITYTLVTSLAANTVTYNATGLTPNTLYYWNVQAVSEGGGSDLLGSQATLPLSPLHGVYAINNLLPTTATLLHDGTDNFQSFTDAINALNDNGVSGPVSFGVIAGQTFAEDCPAITATGTSTNTITFAKFGAGVNPIIQPTGGAGTADAGITINGGDYFTFNGIDITIATGSAVENGYLLVNSSATNGAMNNIIANSKITLNRTNTTARGIYVNHPTAATNATGANSYNTIHKNVIENSYHGIVLTGTSAYPDLACIVDSNIVGAATANDIGNGGSASNGILTSNQNGIAIAANTVRNVTTTGAIVYGIYLEGAQGTNNVFNNKVYTIGTTSTATSNLVYGIRTDINATFTTNVFNNMISDLNHGIATASGTQVIRAIAVGITGTGTGNFAYNSVLINEDAAPSSTALYVNNGIANLVNNVFANTSTPGITSKRYCVYRNGGTIVSDHNDFYIDTTSATGINNFTGYYAADVKYLTGWQTTTGGQDMSSMSVNPTFVSTTDLHTTASALNGTGTPVAGITFDIDGDTRDLLLTDLGADENLAPPTFTCTTPAPGNTIVTPGTICLGESVVVTIQNATPGTGVTYQWQESTDGVTYSDVVGETNPIYSTTPSGAIFYQCVVTCANGPESTPSTAAQVTYSNNVTSTTDGSRCGTGTVDLDAAGSAGTTINWYDAAIGGNLVGTGAPWTTGPINTTTNYYVAAIIATPATLAIGAGASTSSTYSNPFYSLWSNIHTQHMITKAELIAAGFGAGNISSLSLDFTSAGTLPTIDLSIKIGTSSASDMSVFVDNSTFSTIYTSASYMPTAGINTFVFSTPFAWDGNSNIILDFCHGNGSSSATMSRTVKADATSFISSVKSHVSSATAASSICPNTASNLANYSVRPQFIFDGQAICSSPRVEVVATVVDAPTISITPSATTICDGDTLDLNVSSTNVDYTYDWSAGTTPASGADVVATPSANTTYTVSASDNSGGTYDGCAATASVDITVKTSPSSVTATATDNNICIGTAIDLTSSAVSGDNYLDTIFSESFENAGAIPTGWAAELDVDGNGTSAVLSYVSSSSYPTGFSAQDGTYFVRFNSFTVQSGNTARLKDTTGFSTTNLSNVVVNFEWTQDDGYTNNDNVTVEYSLDGTTWTAAGPSITRASTSGDSWTSQSVALPVAAENQSIVYIAFLFSSAYGNDCHIDYVNVSANVAIESTFSWTSNPAGFASNSQDTAGVIPTATTQYIVTAGNSLGCYTSASTTVNVSAYPVVNLGVNQSICDTSSITLNAGNPGATFNWSTGGSSQTEVFDGSVGAGSYDVSVEVTNAAGCATSDTITITVTVCSGIEDPSMSISMYPNPATDVLNLDLSELAYGNYRFELLSLQGQQIMNEVVTNEGSIISVNLSNVAVGSYIVRVSGNNNSFQNYISIQK